jgi:hypothetical protein
MQEHIYYSQIAQASLNPYESSVFIRILWRAGGTKGKCTESISNIAEGCGIGRKKTGQCIASLTEKNIITIDKQEGFCPVITVNPTSKWSTGGESDERRGVSPTDSGCVSQTQGVSPTDAGGESERLRGCVPQTHKELNKEIKEEIKEEHEQARQPLDALPEFQKFWDLYPTSLRPARRDSLWQLWLVACQKIKPADIVYAVKKHLAVKADGDPKYIGYAENFLKNEWYLRYPNQEEEFKRIYEKYGIDPQKKGYSVNVA